MSERQLKAIIELNSLGENLASTACMVGRVRKNATFYELIAFQIDSLGKHSRRGINKPRNGLSRRCVKGFQWHEENARCLECRKLASGHRNSLVNWKYWKERVEKLHNT